MSDIIPQIDEAFMCDSVPAEVMDVLWAAGWRHFGALFFRYSTQTDADGGTQLITPLRIRLTDFHENKSQRRVRARNRDLRTEITPVRLDAELRALFEKHKTRFETNVPGALEDFLGPVPESGPCDSRMLRVFAGEKLLAASFFDVGATAVSSVYAMFDPEEARRGLGIFTLLLEADFARQNGHAWLYSGYATRESSAYDYKKQFRPTEWLDWSQGWQKSGDAATLPLQ